MENGEEKEVTPVNSKSKFFIWYALLLVILVIVITAISSLKEPSKKNVKNEAYYKEKALDIMNENLKDPKSAEFLKVDVDLIGDGESGAYVYLRVRAKNSFGAYDIAEYLIEFDRYGIPQFIPVEDY